MVFRGGRALDGGTIGSEARMVCTVSAIIEVARHPLVLTTIVDGIVIIDCDVIKVRFSKTQVVIIKSVGINS